MHIVETYSNFKDKIWCLWTQILSFRYFRNNQHRILYCSYSLAEIIGISACREDCMLECVYSNNSQQSKAQFPDPPATIAVQVYCWRLVDGGVLLGVPVDPDMSVCLSVSRSPPPLLSALSLWIAVYRFVTVLYHLLSNFLFIPSGESPSETKYFTVIFLWTI